MNDLFCVISAVANNYGAFDYRSRLKQLINTSKSIDEYAPGCDKVLFESSENEIPLEDLNELRKHFGLIAILKDKTEISFLKHNSKDPSPNCFEKKTIGEIVALESFAEWLLEYPKRYRRVFKIAGRYKLNNNFNINDHINADNSLLFLDEKTWSGHTVFLLRLWSFNYSDREKIHQLIQHTKNTVINDLRDNGVLNILESSLNKSIKQLSIPFKTVKVIGVEGFFGQDANPLRE